MTPTIGLENAALLTTREAAKYLDFTENSLRSMRCRGMGPRFHRIGSAVLYDRADLHAYATRNSTTPEKERGAPNA